MQNVIAQLKEGDTCLVENVAIADQADSVSFIEPAVVKFIMGSSLIVEFSNPDNLFGLQKLTFNHTGEVKMLQGKPVDIRLLVANEENMAIIKRYELFTQMQECVKKIGALSLNREKFLAQDDDANREMLAQMQAIEAFCEQIYV